MSKSFYLIIIAVILLLVTALVRKAQGKPVFRPESEKEKAGRIGEKIASGIIESALRDGDYHLHNIEISYEDKTTELDNVVVNRYGVFIIEVKNYSGRIVGKEDDYEWEKYNVTRGGSTYRKYVRNPIKQVGRQVYILSHYLKSKGINVWVDGYAYFVNNNSPVRSKNVLRKKSDIKRVMHTSTKKHLSDKTVAEVVNALKGR